MSGYEYQELKRESPIGITLDITSFTIDIIFVPLTILTLIYTMFLVYGWDAPYQDDWSKIMIIVTNSWAIFPLIVARGIFLKLMILGAMITSFWAHIHWEGFKVPGDEDSPGKWDNVFSTMVIVAYCLEWLPDRWFKLCCQLTGQEKAKLGPWVRETFFDRPKHVNACNFRLDWKTFVQVIVTIGLGIIVWYAYDKDDWMHVTDEFSLIDIVCITFVVLGFVWGIVYICSPHHIYDGKKVNLIVWIIAGTFLGSWAIVSKKLKTDVEDAAHATWHVCIFSAAYCISRAHSYLKILED